MKQIRPNRETAHKLVYRVAQRSRARLRRAWFTPEKTVLSDGAFLAALSYQARSCDAFLLRMRDRQRPRFFFDPQDQQRLVKLAQIHFPTTIERTIELANQACSHTFNLLGSGLVHLGGPSIGIEILSLVGAGR